MGLVGEQVEHIEIVEEGVAGWLVEKKKPDVCSGRVVASDKSKNNLSKNRT